MKVQGYKIQSWHYETTCKTKCSVDGAELWLNIFINLEPYAHFPTREGEVVETAVPDVLDIEKLLSALPSTTVEEAATTLAQRMAAYGDVEVVVRGESTSHGPLTVHAEAMYDRGGKQDVA